MFNRSSLWHKFLALAFILMLIIPVLAACGGDDDKTPTSTPTPAASGTATITPAATPTATVQQGNTSPVKIGMINSWSGPAAMAGLGLADPVIKLVEKQVKDQGGILGGRDVKVVKYDNRASVAEAIAGIKKLYYDEKVSAITVGGTSGAEFNAVAPGCEEQQILYVSIASVQELSKYKFTVNASVQSDVNRKVSLDFIKNVIKPKTVAGLGADETQTRNNISEVLGDLEAAGVKTVYEGYFPLETTDFTPYLTKIKYEKPDLLYTFINSNEPYISIAKQMMELGGWGNTKVFTSPGGASAKNMTGAQGWYMFGTWAPGLDYPGAIKFLDEYTAMFNRDPSATQVYYYNSLWTAIHAVELAGTDTDRVAIAEAARSGNLEWDTPMGHARFQADGTSGLSVIIQEIVNKEVVLAPSN